MQAKAGGACTVKATPLKLSQRLLLLLNAKYDVVECSVTSNLIAYAACCTFHRCEFIQYPPSFIQYHVFTVVQQRPYILPTEHYPCSQRWSQSQWRPSVSSGVWWRVASGWFVGSTSMRLSAQCCLLSCASLLNNDESLQVNKFIRTVRADWNCYSAQWAVGL
jgi:hypothetical protein